MKYYKVRFHLAQGENYMKWQIREKDKEPTYLDPETTQFTLKNCTLKNNKRLAREIHEGANKTVCAWILCEEIHIGPGQTDGTEIQYNPRKRPFWTNGTEDLDNKKFKEITSDRKKLYAKP